MDINFIGTDLKGAYIIETKILKDDKVFFIKTFHANSFKSASLDWAFKETFYTVSRNNVVRGMHFRIPSHDGAKVAFMACGKINRRSFGYKKELADLRRAYRHGAI